MKRYRIKVIEKHSDYVWVTAKNEEQAIDQAVSESECDYESLYDCIVMSEEVIQEGEKDD